MVKQKLAVVMKQELRTNNVPIICYVCLFREVEKTRRVEYHFNSVM